MRTLSVFRLTTANCVADEDLMVGRVGWTMGRLADNKPIDQAELCCKFLC